MKKSLFIAAAVAALAVATQAFAAGPAPAAGNATTAPAASSATMPSTGTATGAATAAPSTTAGQPAASTAAPAAPAAKQAPANTSTSSKLDAMTCADYQKRVDDAMAGSKDAAKIAHAKKDREEGAKLCSSGKHEEGVKHFQTALKDLGVSKTQ